MIYLADTNVITRRISTGDPLHPIVINALNELRKNDDVVYITAQNLVEYRALATRPVAANGLGLSAVQASADTQRLKTFFPLLPETQDILPAWETIVDSNAIVGRQVYDARLAAVMQVYGVTHILTFDTGHFQRLAGIIAVDPSTV